MSKSAVILHDTKRGALFPAARQSVSSGATAQDWITLLKPRVVSLVTFTGLIGLLVAPGHIDHWRAMLAILSIAGAAGAGGAINMWYDRDIDLIMYRTRLRPIPARRITPAGALAFGVAIAALSIAVMAWATNLVAASLLALSLGFYVFIYTIWLKRRTVYNIVIGGAAGAFPPIIGWAAVTGSIAVVPVLLFAIVFLWTPPHFWSLALWANADYRRAGIPMLPVIAGARETRRQILFYTGLLLPVSLVPWVIGFSGSVYASAATLLGIGFMIAARRVVQDDQDVAGNSLTDDAPAKAAFRYSIIYLFALFAAFSIDHLLW